VVEPVREKRDLAMHLGADSAFAPSDLVAPVESVGALSGGYGADMAVEAAGAAASTLAYGAEEAKVCIDFLETGKLATAGMLSGIIPLENVVVEGLERLRRDRRLVKLAVRP
jgi:threonine dehydrogenase-like Zn-dependent dehydrogenase